MDEAKTPPGLDEFLTDMDPQSAIASQGLEAGAQALGQVPAVQQAMDFSGNLAHHDQLVQSAMAGDPVAQQALAEHNAGIAMGSVDMPANGAIQRIHKALGLELKPVGIKDRVKAAEELFNKAQAGVQAGQIPPEDMAFVIQHLRGARRNANKNSFAEGGEVAPPEGLDEFLSQPQSLASPSEPEGLDEFIEPEMNAIKHSGGLEQFKAGAEGLAQGLIGPVAPAIETNLLGVDPKNILAREKGNPGTHYATEALGFVAPAIASGGSSIALKGLAKATQIGVAEAVARKLIPAAGETLGSKIGINAAKVAVENMLLSGSDEVSKMLLNDPEQSAGTALSHIGLAGALGVGIGGAAKGVPALWKATIGDKAAKLVADFKGRIAEHISNPEPAEAIGEELSGYYKAVKDLHTPGEPLTPGAPKEGVIDPFKVRSFASPEGVAFEDTVIGKKSTQKLQQKLSDSYEDFKPFLKAFQKKFASEITPGDSIIDPAKISTYVNQLDKPNAEIKKSILRNFLDASEKYKKIVDKIYTDAGKPSPISDTPMNMTLASLDKKTAGAKLADAFIDKGLTEGGSHTLGASIGAGLGGLLGGHTGGVIGAVVGSHALSPFFNSVLPGIAKYIVQGKASAESLKASIDYGMAVVKGESLLSRATQNIFRPTASVLADNLKPSDKDIAKLDKLLRVAQVNPEAMFQKSTQNEYLPHHGVAFDQTTATAVSYLNSIRTNLDRKAPLDSKPIASSSQKASYENALKIAQQPVLIMDKLKEGTITSQDIAHLSAMYPSLYMRMRQKLTDNMVDAINSGQPIPYKTRIGLTLFLNQPMDSTMSASSIQAAQSAGTTQQPTKTDEVPSQPRGVKSSPALQKLPGMYETSLQTKQAQHQKQR